MAKTAQGDTGGNGNGDAGSRRKRRCQGVLELTEDDPTVLHELPKLDGYEAQSTSDLDLFLSHALHQPDVAQVCKLKKGMLKKALQAQHFRS